MIRRLFLARGLVAVAATLALPRRAHAALGAPHAPRALGPHPKPRPGITAAKIMSPEQVARFPRLVDAFEGVREIPEVVDGLRCHCGCADLPGFYSLLTCYEGDAPMALGCPICQGEGRMVARLHKEGASLDAIREALDSKYA